MAAAAFAEAGEGETARSFVWPSRTVLLALTPRGADVRSAEYARGVCKRIDAGLEVLVWSGRESQNRFVQDFKRQLNKDDIPWRLETAAGCLKKKIIEHTERRSDIHFVVVESSEELEIGCDEDSGVVTRFFERLRCPLVVVSEAQGTA